MNVFDRVKKIQNLNRAVNTKELVEESRNFIKYDQPSLWDYSKEYLGIASEGLRKPPPSFGSPTFIWHLGVWQRWIDPGQNDKSKNLNHKITSFEQCNEIFFQDISRFVNLIQERGRILGLPTEKLNFESPDYLPGITKQFGDADHPDNQDMNYEHIFKVCEPQSVSFTLWWVDEDENGKSIQNTRLIKPEYSALRVRVQVQTHIDHATLSFFIDAAKPYNSGQIYQTPKIAGNKRADFGRRRDKVANHLDIVRRIAREQVSSGAIERDRIPEMNVTADDAKRLREAADYFYDGIWQEFKTSFGIVRDQLSPDQNNEGVTFAGRMGRIFADIRGVMMSSDWIVSEEQKAANRSRVDKARKSANMPEGFISREREANVGIGSFRFFRKS
ncbi:MAG: hypothetical protein HC850_05575 [Rhodomicrobium sp.]|nr:hypothetical protein [Rhodomicrobium sp.]